MKSPLCPRCKTRRMVRNVRRGVEEWQCRPTVDRRRTDCYSTRDPSQPVRVRVTGYNEELRVFKRTLSPVKRLIITSAQNATPVHDKFWQSLVQYAKTNKA